MLFNRKKSHSQRSQDKTHLKDDQITELPGDVSDEAEPMCEIEKAQRDIMLACLEAVRKDEEQAKAEAIPHSEQSEEMVEDQLGSDPLEQVEQFDPQDLTEPEPPVAETSCRMVEAIVNDQKFLQDIMVGIVAEDIKRAKEEI